MSDRIFLYNKYFLIKGFQTMASFATQLVIQNSFQPNSGKKKPVNITETYQ